MVHIQPKVEITHGILLESLFGGADTLNNRKWTGKRGTKMESSQTGNGTEENDKTGGCRYGEQVATINHDMPPFALKHNLDLNRSLFLTVTFYLQSFEERERCYVVR